jgi:universal stress protein A
MAPKNILVPIDFSQASERALDYACSLASKLGATVHLVNALGPRMPELDVTLSDAMFQSLRDGHLATLQKYADPRRALASFGEIVVKDSDPRDAILEVTEKLGIDLVVMGTHGRRGLARAFLGSVAEDVSRRSPCPVLLVRMKKDVAS